MAVVFIEGFDFMTAAQTIQRGWSNAPASMQTGRFGGQCARITASGSTAATRALGGTYTTIFFGFAVRSGNFTSARDVLILKAGATLTCRIGFDTSGRITVKNSAGTTIATGTVSVSAATWAYIEFKLFINAGTPASGTIEVHLNGAPEIGTTTGNFGSTGVDSVNYTIGGVAITTDYDDMYGVDTTGSAPNNTFLGDVRVSTEYPNGDGAHSQWTPTGGGTHYTEVDDTTPDDDTTYVSDSTPNDIDTYTFSDVDGGATVYGVQVNMWARKDDAATRQIAPLIRQASVDYPGNTVTLASTYTFYSQVYDQDPTSNPWTAANVNADEFGVKEIA